MKKIGFFLIVLALLSACKNKNRPFADAPSATLPLVEISIPQGEDSLTRTDWTVGCGIKITGAADSVLYCSEGVSLKRRGHSTYDKPKRPYAIKLPQKASLLGLPARKRYILLACFFDHSLMRNALAFEAARQTSLAATTPQGRFARLSVNGNYQGVYYICEAVRDVTDNALLEFDAYAAREDEYTFYTSSCSLPVSVKRPERYPNSTLVAMKNFVNAADSNPVAFVDFDTFADYWLVQELCMNAEPAGPRSCYVQLTPAGRLQAGPVWDFDLAFNPVGVDAGGDLRPMRFRSSLDARWLNVDSLYNAEALWYSALLADTAFRRCVVNRWNMLRPRFANLTAYADSLHALIRPSAVADQKMWNAHEPARFDSCTGYDSAVRNLRDTYERRLVALDKLINRMVGQR